MENNEIIATNTNGIALPAIVRDGMNQLGMYVTINDPDSAASKVAVYNATATSTSLSDEIGTPITVKGIVIQPTEMEDMATGQMVPSIMTVLIDEQGHGHRSHGKGVLSAVGKLLALFGSPDQWPDGMKVVPVEETGRRGFKYVTLNTVL